LTAFLAYPQQIISANIFSIGERISEMGDSYEWHP